VLADGEDNSLAGARHHNGVLEENHVGVLLDILIGVFEAALFDGELGANLVGEELFLVNFHVHLLDQDAVGRDAVALTEEDDVANN
jgi:hypothetical protein